MIARQVKEFFKDKKNAPCPLTERLIKSGYQQTSGGYINLAKRLGLSVDYSLAKPTQYWHLIEEYIPSVPEDRKFGKNIICGELIFWMAEVSLAVPKPKLETLLERIIASKKLESTRPKYDRTKWNKEIQNLCFDAIVDLVEKKIAN